MMMKPFAVLGVAALGISLAASAHAQTSQPTGLSVRAGAFFPQDSDARRSNKTWFAIGLEYKLRDVTSSEMMADGWQSAWSISLDNFGSGDFRSTPLLLNYVGRQNQFFWSAGAGIGFNRTFGSDSRTEFAFQLGVGWEFPMQGSNPFFVEAKYWGGNRNLSGIGLYGGVRF